MSYEILKSIINDFNVEKFTRFFRAKNDKFKYPNELMDYDKAENNFTLLDSKHLTGFAEGRKLAEGKLDDGEFIVSSFLVKQPLSERSGKKAQYELGKKILRETQTDAGIFIFYDVQGNFRFSLIYTNYLGKRRDWSNFKRFTYFVSPELTNKTFLKQIGEGDFSTLENIKEAFSVDPVTKQFYNEIQSWYFWAMDKIKFPDDYNYSTDPTKDKEIRNATNLIRLITRIIFIWFLKEKKLVSSDLFSMEKLAGIIRDFMKGKKASNFYNAVLQNLFFGTLNQKINERKFTDERGYPANKKEYGVKNLYRYADKFLINKNEVLRLFKDTPFLNGGLFDCLDKENKEDETKKVIDVDGFSRNPAKQSIIPDYLFFQQEEEKVDLSQYGLGTKLVRGLIEILNSYNFTIDENTPVDQEIALDPELLGKVFENLLASYNPETATTARKATGSYYTPREIVDYMVETSLFEYLINSPSVKGCQPEVDGVVSPSINEFPSCIGELEEKLRLLLSYSEDVPVFSKEEKQRIISAIDEIKILDPACGSGAFPMGILHKLVYALQKLDPKNEHWRELQCQKALKESEEVFKQGDKNQREERLKEINETFDEGINYPDYARKLYLIENCIYGVDIQPIAIQISKLRFFISLVLDQKEDSSKENFGIRALPNLETRFVSANTLIGLDKPDHLFYTDEVKKLEDEIKSLRHKYFTAKTRREKIDYQNKDKELRELLAKELREIGFPSESSEKIAKFDLYDQNASADFFDPEWMFGIRNPSPLTGEGRGEGGFDIVIANPPYVSFGLRGVEKAKKDWDRFIRTHYPNSAEYKLSTYAIFMDKGTQLLNDGGILCYITPDSYLLGRYFSKLRTFILNSASIKQILMFENDFWKAGVVGRPTITLIQKNQPKGHCKVILYKDLENFIKGLCLQNAYSQEYFNGNKYKRFRLFFSNRAKKFVEIVETNSVPLGDIARITTGVRSKIGQEKIVSNKPLGSNYKKGIISSSHVYPFIVKWEGHYLNIDKKLLWSGGWDPNIVENSKIMIRQTGDSLIAGIDKNGFYHLNNVHSLSVQKESISLEYICAMLNSKLMNKFYQLISLEKGRTMAQTDIDVLETLPIKLIEMKDQKNIIELVHQSIHKDIKNQIFAEIDDLISEIYKLPVEMKRYIMEDNLY